MKIPFYIPYDVYTNWVTSNFTSLQLTDDSKFIGYILLNIAMLFLIYFIIKLFKFFIILIKNCIFR